MGEEEGKGEDETGTLRLTGTRKRANAAAMATVPSEGYDAAGKRSDLAVESRTKYKTTGRQLELRPNVMGKAHCKPARFLSHKRY